MVSQGTTKLDFISQVQKRIEDLGLGHKFTFEAFHQRIEEITNSEINFISDADLSQPLPNNLTGFVTCVGSESMHNIIVCYNNKYVGRNLMLVLIHELVHVWLGEVKIGAPKKLVDVIELINQGNTGDFIWCRSEKGDEHEQEVEFIAIDVLDRLVTIQELDIIKSTNQLF